MGARVYIPSLGRFAQVDPVEGGVDNSYVYPPDPVNDFDLDGAFSIKKAFKAAATVASVASVIPGPIGMAAAGAAAISYAAAGDKRQALIAAAGIAAAAVGAGAAVQAYKAVKIANTAKAGQSLARFGAVSKTTSNLAGRIYTGRYLAPIKKQLVSRDSLRQYRAPMFKPRIGIKQSNFVKRGSIDYKFGNKNRSGYYNGHLRIR